MILTFSGRSFQSMTSLFKNPYYFMSIFMLSFRYEFAYLFDVYSPAVAITVVHFFQQIATFQFFIFDNNEDN